MESKLLLFLLGLFVVSLDVEARASGGYSGEGKRVDRPKDELPDYLFDVKFDEYPMIVPKKRTALLIDRLMVSLQKALEEEQARENEENSALSSKSDVLRTMDLQRRGHGNIGSKNGRAYWRCYFNAVTCF